uniref:No apical meristem-associated C-terminal domain-containing protein n=1 Tax=Lactuca sativa TaxID=4236 RepID=A0A9R1W6Z8_LACSA|nr:hypothetical protein LSAT_V11C300109410 [Lactuca sativa]
MRPKVNYPQESFFLFTPFFSISIHNLHITSSQPKTMDPNQNTPPNYRNCKPDNAFVLDTTPRQFPAMESPQGGQKPARPTTAQERVPWTKEEEEKLAEAWVVASKDPIIRDSQPYGSFWEKVRAIFYELMESETRNADQITSKWRDIRLKCTEFGGIYNNLLNIRKSGSNDFDVFKAAMDQFEKTTPTRKAFPYMKPWLKLKDAPKWKEQTEGTSRSSDLENDQPLRRPVGRNKAKKAASTSSNSSVTDMFDDKFDRYVQLQETKVKVMTRMEQKMIEAQTSFQEAQETLQTKTDMEILKMKADDLEGEDLKLFQAMKESVRARRRRRGYFILFMVGIFSFFLIFFLI